jgi:RNA-binding protein NOB1
MGLNVVSVDGVVIHETKTWIKRCYACFKTVPDVSKEFCPKCGNKTLKRVSVTLNADGSMKVHISGDSKLKKKLRSRMK